MKSLKNRFPIMEINAILPCRVALRVAVFSAF
jgi:hypothetical protein